MGTVIQLHKHQTKTNPHSIVDVDKNVHRIQLEDVTYIGALPSRMDTWEVQLRQSIGGACLLVQSSEVSLLMMMIAKKLGIHLNNRNIA